MGIGNLGCKNRGYKRFQGIVLVIHVVVSQPSEIMASKYPDAQIKPFLMIY